MSQSSIHGTNADQVPPVAYKTLVTGILLFAACVTYGVVVTIVNGHGRFNAYGWAWELLACLLIAGALYITFTVGRTQRVSRTLRDSFAGLSIAGAIVVFIAGTDAALGVGTLVWVAVFYALLSSPLRLKIDDRIGYTPSATRNPDGGTLI